MRQRTSRGWAAFTIIGLAIWIGATVYVASQAEPGSDSKAATQTFAICGAIFFGLMFIGAGVGMRRSQTQGTSELYQRLAINPVPAATVRKALRGAHTIGYVYLAFGVMTTFIMLAAIWFGDDGLTRTLLYVVLGLVVIWAIYAGFAIKRVFSVSDVLMAPLGLKLTELPVYVPNLFTSGGQMHGTATYEGERNDRNVVVMHGADFAATVVGGRPAAKKAPTTAQQMMNLTGEPFRVWKGAEVTVTSDGVSVTRKGNGSGRWFLQDLLLAERVANG